jgi:hypothetical protein
MDVLNRKLFANKEARNKLAEMGGIMASSEALMREVQNVPMYAPGGVVDAPQRQPQFVITIPGYRNGAMLRINESTLMMMNDTIPDLMSQEGTQVFPVEMFGDSDAALKIRPGDAIINADLNPRQEQVALPEQSVTRKDTVLERKGLESMFGGPDLSDYTGERTTFSDVMTNPAYDASLANTQAIVPDAGPSRTVSQEQQSATPVTFPAPETFVEDTEEQDTEIDVPEVTTNLATGVADAFAKYGNPADASKYILGKILADKAGPEGKEPPPSVDDMDIKTRVKTYENLFKEMFDEKDEDKTKEMYLNLAMIGFAVASGTSSNALTNISQGLMQGVTKMNEDRATRTARGDKTKMLAFEAAIDDRRTDKKTKATLDYLAAKSTAPGKTVAVAPADATFWGEVYNASFQLTGNNETAAAAANAALEERTAAVGSQVPIGTGLTGTGSKLTGDGTGLTDQEIFDNLLP